MFELWQYHLSLSSIQFSLIYFMNFARKSALLEQGSAIITKNLNLSQLSKRYDQLKKLSEKKLTPVPKTTATFWFLFWR